MPLPVIVGRNKEDNELALSKINKGGHVVAELSDPAQCKSAVEEILAAYGRIDGLVNNAGVNDSINLEQGSYEGFMSSLHKNVVHYYLMAHHALPEIIKAKGQLST
jgi:NAD(P)-dependent dehydrogenase (short-subunit alcohol dehydrogenase family)